MRCPNCRRENPGIRLFCSRCGELLPDFELRESDTVPRETDDDIKIYRKAAKTEPAPAQDSIDMPIPSEAALSEETDFFARREKVRRLYEEDWPELHKKKEPQPRVRERLFDVDADEKPQSDEESPYARPKQENRRPPTLARRHPTLTGRPSTLVPRRETPLDPENPFVVRGEIPLDMDDDDHTPRARRLPRRASRYEESESQSFFMRHVRGIVGMILLAVTVAIVLAWAYTPNAQLVLAQLDLAWSASAYASLGSEAYDAGQFGEAGRYFTAALSKDSENFDYAIYAANSFIQGGETAKAISALKKLITLQPDKADYYVTLLGLYGSYENMPTDAKTLINEGYRRTGDERLKY